MFNLQHTYTLSLLYVLFPLFLPAQPQYQWQNEAPIANFAWDENDTTRYANHYLFERAYSTYQKHYQEALDYLLKKHRTVRKP